MIDTCTWCDSLQHGREVSLPAAAVIKRGLASYLRARICKIALFAADKDVRRVRFDRSDMPCPPRLRFVFQHHSSPSFPLLDRTCPIAIWPVQFSDRRFLVKREIFAWISVTCSRSKLIPKRGDAERDKGEQTLAERYTIGRWATHSLVNLSWWF